MPARCRHHLYNDPLEMSETRPREVERLIEGHTAGVEQDSNWLPPRAVSTTPCGPPQSALNERRFLGVPCPLGACSLTVTSSQPLPLPSCRHCLQLSPPSPVPAPTVLQMDTTVIVGWTTEREASPKFKACGSLGKHASPYNIPLKEKPAAGDTETPKALTPTRDTHPWER